MAIIRTKNNVPQVYVSESRDFQIFTRVLDFVQNGLKYDIDAMLNSVSTRDIAESYLEHLKSKIGFFTDTHYDNDSLRKVLSAMPHIIRNKGSELGISMCINTFLNIVGFRKGYTVSIYHEDENYDYTIRIGIEGSEISTELLMDMLSYVIPTGYMIEFYFYTSVDVNPTTLNFNSNRYVLTNHDYKLVQGVRDEDDLEEYISKNISSSDVQQNAEKARSTYNTVHFTTVYEPTQTQTEVSLNE